MDRSSYRCKVAHTSTNANKPGSGANWTDYWEYIAIGGVDGVDGNYLPTDTVLTSIDAADLIPFEDVSAGTTHRITKANLLANVATIYTGTSVSELTFTVGHHIVTWMKDVSATFGQPLNNHMITKYLIGGFRGYLPSSASEIGTNLVGTWHVRGNIGDISGSVLGTVVNAQLLQRVL